MTIRAGGRVALIAAVGLLACAGGASWTVAASDAAEIKSEQASTSKKVKQVRHYKRHASRKYHRTAQKPSEEKKPAPTDVAETNLPSELPGTVANANARMGGEVSGDAAQAMSASADALATREQPPESQGAVSVQMAEADQLNEVDKAIKEPTPPSQTTVAVAPTRSLATAKPAVEETSTWDQTSLIGKIFIAFGALLTVASAARMFMA
ncbi:MAG: hypothetical protein AB7I42_09885 [Bradyrhizobium sp.]|uniref:hypothetical protein n=1 Tax=Bradyrhizobium sp. TaxID=376 RepID=UPI003D11DCF3